MTSLQLQKTIAVIICFVCIDIAAWLMHVITGLLVTGILAFVWAWSAQGVEEDIAREKQIKAKPAQEKKV